jgi:putative tricarboxylic transport membrane protein
MESVLIGIKAIFDISTLLIIAGGVVFGFIIGALPGLTGNMAIALMVPVTFTMEPINALAFLTAIYCSSIFGGSVSAILLGIPGTVSSMATVLDGYPMAQQGKAGQALGIATLSSVFGGLFSAAVLMFLAPQLAEQALKFGPSEYFAVAVLGLTCIASIGGGSILRGLLSGVIGLAISTIGMDPQTGQPRFTFGNINLYEGIELVPALIGIFGVVAILKIAEKSNTSQDEGKIPNVGSVWIGIKGCISLIPTWIRGSIIGTIIGIIPGAGTNIATFVSYDMEMKISKEGTNFGKGEPKGIAAPEAANNGVTGGSLVPLLALGVPGNATSALFLGAIMIHGLRVGPVLFTDYPDIVNGLFVSFFVANLIMAPVGLFLLRYMKLILSIPEKIMAGVIAAFCVTGVYALNNNPFDLGVLAVFGTIGYAFYKFKMPTAPLIVAMVLGEMAENSLRQAVKLSRGNYSFLYDRPITFVILIVSVLSFLAPVIAALIRHMKSEKQEKAI